jgi:hypothetical protein
MTEPFCVHSISGKPPSEWQPVEEHLKNVAELARSFAEKFGGSGIDSLCEGNYTSAFGKAVCPEFVGGAARRDFQDLLASWSGRFLNY